MHSASDDWITGNVYSRPGNEQAHSTTLKNPPKIASIHTKYKLLLSARASARTTRQYSSTFIQYSLSLLSAAVTSSTMSQDTGLWSVRRPREVSTTRLKWPNLFVAHWREQQPLPSTTSPSPPPFPEVAAVVYNILTLMSSRRPSEELATTARSHSQRPQ